MAELDTSAGGKKGKGKKRAKKASTRVDLTPMVDLAFLLVTFFMMTTTFSKPQTMEINMPVKDKTAKVDEQTQDTKASKALTVILDEFDRVVWFRGLSDTANYTATDFSSTGLRSVLLDLNRSVGEELVVLIKPTEKSKYKNVVDALDEMNICNIKRYALVDITEPELKKVREL